MKERPILFSAPMVRALLSGAKTQTRRICKPAEAHGLSFVVEVPDPRERGQVYNGSRFGDEEGDVQFASPYGCVGDRLWVRETWQDAILGTEAPADLDDENDYENTFAGVRRYVVVNYRADAEPAYREITLTEEQYQKLNSSEPRGEWTPSIHMPRWASRITLEITDVRVERLQGISEADAQAEGVTLELGTLERLILGAKATYRSGFVRLWESINGPGSWDANPWVWVLTFRRVTP